MVKYIILIILSCCSSEILGQVVSKDLLTIKTVSEAEMFIQKNPKMDGKIFTINSGIDTSEIITPLYTKKQGFVFRIDDYNYKILQIDSALSFRVNYIYLNGEQLSKNQIDSLRKEIIASYKSGTSFINLASQYNMDGNISGDTGWFTENMMVKEFENAVRTHKKSEIFTVDTPSQNWYHIVLKSYEDTFIKRLTLLQIKKSG